MEALKVVYVPEKRINVGRLTWFNKRVKKNWIGEHRDRKRMKMRRDMKVKEEIHAAVEEGNFVIVYDCMIWDRYM